MEEVKVTARYDIEGVLIEEDEFIEIVFSHPIIDRILAAVNMRLGLENK